MTRKEALDILMSANVWNDEERTAWEVLVPELAESEDERILRVISEAVITFFSDYANDFEDEDRDAALAWLEKQKVFSNGEGCYYYHADGSYTFIGSMGFGPIEDIKINGERPKTENKSVSVDLPGACPCVEKQKESLHISETCKENADSFKDEDERIRRTLVEYFGPKVQLDFVRGVPIQKIRDWLEKQKENPKSADSIPSDCASDAKCEDRWHKVSDSLPDNGRLVLANDCLGNTLLARYDGEGNWEVSVYDNEDYYCRNTITKWCEIPSEKQKEQKPVSFSCGHENDKPAWSEEDEENLNSIISCLNRSLDGVIDTVEITNVVGEIAWLKSLRPQYHGDVTMTEAYKMGLEAGKASSWKPSEEQMEALESAVKLYKDTHFEIFYERIVSLYEQLKKLI